MLFLSFTLQAYEGLRLAQLGLESAATGLMLDACRGTSMCNTTHCMGIDDLSYGGQGEEDIENWRALYLRPQSKQLSNPKFAVFCDNWDAATAYAPYLNEQASSVRDQIASTCAYKTTSDWNPAQPYARLCVPTKTGVKKGIDPSSYILRINPFGADTDSTSNTFYKSWISNGQIKNAMCGAAMH